MKQSELDRDLSHTCKAEAGRRAWKCVGGMPYWTIGPLFFVLISSARVKERAFHSSLHFKWLALDRELWRVLDMSSNEQAPFSLHANGAFVLRGQEILSLSKQIAAWSPDVLETEVDNASAQAEQRALQVASQIDSLESYLRFIRHEHEAFMRRHPGAVINIHREELLAALLGKQFSRAKQIAVARIEARDEGGFSSNRKSFYENALPFCRGDA